MTRRVDGDGKGPGSLFWKLGEKLRNATSATGSKKKRQERYRMDRDSRRKMSGRGYPAGYGLAGPMTLAELLALLDVDERTAVLALNEAQQADLLRVWEACDRRLQGTATHKTATLAAVRSMIRNGRLCSDRQPLGGLLVRLVQKLDRAPTGLLRGRMDGLTYLSHVVLLLAEPRISTLLSAAQPMACLANSLALGWPARWAEISLALAFDGSWKGIPAVLRPGGSPPDGLLQGSLQAYAEHLTLEEERAPEKHRANSEAIALAVHSSLARVLETDRGAELDVEGRDPSWALEWLNWQLAAKFPTRAGVIIEGKGRMVRIKTISDRVIVCEEAQFSALAFGLALRRVVVDGDFLARVVLKG